MLWGLLIEDFLKPNRLTLDEFCDEFTGSWVFGYVDALRAAGVEAVVVAVSSSVMAATRRRHKPTGAEILLLPPTRLYRLLRRIIRAPHGRTVSATFRGPPTLHSLVRPLLFLLKELAPYVSMRPRTLVTELRSLGCHVLLCQEYEYPRFDVCVAFGRRRGLHVFGVFQGGDYQRWRVERLLRPLAIRRADGLIIPSRTEAERVRARYRPRSVALLPNPIDLSIWRSQERGPVRRELAIPERALVAAWHGRVELRKKGLDTLLDAWAIVTAANPEAVLLMIGTGGDSAAVRQRIAMHRLQNIVWIDRYLHEREEVARLLSCADIYMFSSRHEGFPVAPIEAMACGLPVVATDVGGIREVIADGEASGGMIVPIEDSRQLAQQALRLFTDDRLRRELAEAARSQAEMFGHENIGRRVRDFVLPK